MELSFLCAPSTTSTDMTCANLPDCLQSTGQALTDCPNLMRKQDSVPGGSFLVQQCGVLAGMWEAAGATCHLPGFCALLLLFAVKLLLRDTLMKYKCKTCFKWEEPRDEQQVLSRQ